MKIVHYCQHVLGLGHFMRSLAVAEALSGHDVIFVTGGPDVGYSFPPHVRQVRLPALEMDEEFKTLRASDSDTDSSFSIEALQDERKRLLWNVFESERPDVFLVELYPFGRKRFEFELLPVLEAIREDRFGPCVAISSLRDILVEKTDQAKFERRVIDRLGRYFDALVVHSDDRVFSLRQTFSRCNDIPIPVVSSGFVAKEADPTSRNRIRTALGLGEHDGLVVASAGGGKVGGPLMSAVVDAFLDPSFDPSVSLHIFTGPFLDDSHYDALTHRVHGHKRIHIERFTDDFLGYLCAADVCVSMAGYNTMMNILSARVPAVVWPFDQNREQRFRAERFATMWPLTVLPKGELNARTLAQAIGTRLNDSRPDPTSINLDGAKQTAQYIVESTAELIRRRV
ncbi:glycosyltransferase family protein [Desulfovibrio inopinatus]|uniref:glycosyltransferase family protein n=1 Tax=Desulfovibrio inopinatus TaxID=102109 RepID=UPI0004244749|nr:glycosyltransferase [Desulfovibrio inopinatus]